MSTTRLEALLKSEGVECQHVANGVMVIVPGLHATYDIRCTPFQEDGVRAQVLFPQNKSADLVSMKLLCKELKDHVDGVEFGYFTEFGNFCVSAFLGLETGLSSDLNSLAEIADKVLPLLHIAEEGKPFTQEHIYLAFYPREKMFNA